MSATEKALDAERDDVAQLPQFHRSYADRSCVKLRLSSCARSLAVLALVLFGSASYFGAFNGMQGLAHESAIDRALVSLGAASDVCPQESEYISRSRHVHRPSVRKSVERLSSAVQFNTSVPDNWPSPQSDGKRWEALFEPYRNWLAGAFPKLYEALRMERVDEHGLLYTWEGSDTSLKPLLLMAHQDVVPVFEGSVRDWRYPPFSGHVDEDRQVIWGRGSLDAKSWMIASMSAIDTLAAAGWKPQRTILLSFGFDEESGGIYGARHLAKFIERRYGRDSIAMLLDEGLTVLPAKDPVGFGVPVAPLAVQEKGTVSMILRIDAMGGHSSMPPPHTSIGLMAQIIELLENNPSEPEIVPGFNPALRQLQCLRDAPAVSEAVREALYRIEGAEKALEHPSALDDRLPPWSRWLEHRLTSRCKRKERWQDAARKLLKVLGPREKVAFVTTQAVDVIQGGIKINALPESVTAAVNHRIATFSSTADVEAKYIKLLEPYARKHGLTLSAFGKTYASDAPRPFGNLTIEASGWKLEKMPETAYDGRDANAFRLLSSVVRQTWHSDEPRHELRDSVDAAQRPSSDAPPKYKDPILVTPSSMVANTDTHWYRVRIAVLAGADRRT